MSRKLSSFSFLFLIAVVLLINGCSQEKELLVQKLEPFDEGLVTSNEEQETIIKKIRIPQGAIELLTDAPQDVVVQGAYATDDKIFISFTCKRAGKLHLDYSINSSDGEPVLHLSNTFFSIVPNEEYIVDDIETLRHRPKLPEENWSPIVFSWED